MEKKESRCIVVAAGDIMLSEIEIREDDYIIAVDGGYLYCKLLHIDPHFIVGDFDSVEEKERKEIDEIKKKDSEKVRELPCEKDDTDMRAALKFGLDKGYRNFIIYGGTGGRLEHTIANLQCLIYLKNHGAKGYMMEDESMLTVIKNESICFKQGMEGLVSVFSMGEKAEGVSIRGMKYPLNKVTLTNDFPIGISNEFTQETGELEVENGTLAVIVRW